VAATCQPRRDISSEVRRPIPEETPVIRTVFATQGFPSCTGTARAVEAHTLTAVGRLEDRSYTGADEGGKPSFGVVGI